MADFAKLFNNGKYGQILVKLDKNEDEIPEVRIYIQPEDLGVCSLAVSFTDDDEGWDRAEKAFEKFDEDLALDTLAPLLKLIDTEEHQS